MLNPDFSRKIKNADWENYILPEKIISWVVQQNKKSDSGPELRLQRIYGDELWLKIKSLGLKESDFENKKILDICCGTGFVAFHLLKRIKPEKLTILDISEKEIITAKNLLTNNYPGVKINCAVADAVNSRLPAASFDIIIGNSFLHHFYNIPVALKEFYRLLKPGGVFISLHEPTIASTAFESKNPWNYWFYLTKGKKYIDFISERGLKRYPNVLVRPGGGSDVWLFYKNELVDLFCRVGFIEVKKTDWHFLRPIIVAFLKLHLNKDKRRLSFSEELLQAIATRFDSILRYILPSAFFASLSIKGEKYR